MERLVAGFVASSILLGMFVFTSLPSRAQGSAPQWTTGDYWEYAGKGNISGALNDIVERYEVKERTMVTIGNHSYDSFHLSVMVSMTAGDSSMSIGENAWTRVSDCANVKTEMNLLFIHMNITFDPPQQVLDFPLNDGKTWSSTSIMSMWAMDTPPTNTTVTANYFVSGPQRAIVPAGAFDSFNVTETTMGASSSTYYSDQVGYFVKTGFAPTSGLAGYSMSPFELKSYNYQKAGGLVWIVLIAIIVVAVVLAVAVAMIVRSRRKRRMIAQMPLQGPVFGEPPLQQPPPDQPPAQPPKT